MFSLVSRVTQVVAGFEPFVQLLKDSNLRVDQIKDESGEFKKQIEACGEPTLFLLRVALILALDGQILVALSWC